VILAAVVFFCSLYAGDLFGKPATEENLSVPLLRSPLLSTHTEYYLQCKSTPGRQLDVLKNQPLGKLQLWESNTSYAQRFFFVTAGQDTYRIVKGQDFFFLLVKPLEEDKMIIPFLSEDKESASGLWHIIPSGEAGYYFLLSDVDGKALSVRDSDKEKELIVLEKLTGADSQKWQLIPAHKK
jgi:hypothetical protein